MSNVFYVVGQIFNRIFTYNLYGGSYGTIFKRLIFNITSQPYLLFGVIFVIIGFVVSAIKRLIQS